VWSQFLAVVLDRWSFDAYVNGENFRDRKAVLMTRLSFEEVVTWEGFTVFEPRPMSQGRSSGGNAANRLSIVDSNIGRASCNRTARRLCTEGLIRDKVIM